MKRFGLLCILLILVHFSTQVPKFENCPENVINSFNGCDCCTVECISQSEGTEIKMKGVACPVSFCAPGTQIGYHEDKTKVYPDCCGHPVCEGSYHVHKK